MQILVIKERHGTSYFQASTPEELDKSCKKILGEKLSGGYYDSDVDFKKSVEDIINSAMIFCGKKRKIIRSYELLISRENYEYESVTLEEVI